MTRSAAEAQSRKTDAISFETNPEQLVSSAIRSISFGSTSRLRKILGLAALMAFAGLLFSPAAMAIPKMTCSGTTGLVTLPFPAAGFANRTNFDISSCDGPNIAVFFGPIGLFPAPTGYDVEFNEVGNISPYDVTSPSSYQTVTGSNGGQYGVYWDVSAASNGDGYYIYVISPPGSGTSDTLTFSYVTVSNACLNSPQLGIGGAPCDQFGNPFTDGTVTIQLGTAMPAPPTVTAIIPASGATAGGTTVTINGTNLTGATAVVFGSTNATFIVPGSTQITATAPAGSAGTVDVRVTTSGGTSATSASDQFTYVATPTVTAVSPVSGPNGGGTSVSITGTGFASASATGAVKFGGASATYTINSNTSITATAPAGSAGTVDVTVTTTGGTSATSGADQFTYIAAPTVTAVSPVSGSTGGGAAVSITGTGFASASATGAVKFGATSATYTINSNTSITATAPAGSAGTVDVRVTTGGGTSATSGADQFTYVAAPTVTAISPVSGAAGGGAAVSITGTGFASASATGAVKFGGASATYTINSNTSITATAPAGSAGTVDVTVTTTGGTSATSGADQFTYIAAPTVTAVSPLSGATGGGAAVTITGTGFSSASATGAVKFGPTSATYTINSNTQITATSPAESAGTVDLTVTTTGGTSATSGADRFTYVAGPTATQAIASLALTQNHTLTAFTPVTGSGGAAPLGYSVSPSLPSGLTLSSTTGAITGTPLVTGSATSYTVTVTDANSATAMNTFILTVNSAVTATQAVTTATLTQSHAITSFTPVTGSGGTGPLSYSVSPTLPAGLSIAPGTGAISGTPTVASTATTYSVTVTDSNNATGTASFSLTINTPLNAGAKSATVAYNSNGSTSTAIDLTSSITGGVATSVSVVAAPVHGSATTSGLVVTYTPVAGYYGTDSFSYTATGGSDTSGSAVVSITVSAPSITVSPASLASGVVNTAYTQSLTASGGASPYTFSTTVASGSLPAGLILSSAGFISGTPTSACTCTFTVSGTDVSTGNGPVSFTSSTISLSISAAAPTVSSITPTLGIGTGGATVTIHGTYFTADSTVKFGSASATSVTYLSPTTLTAVAPAGTGTVDVTVTADGGTSATTAADQFSYIAQVAALTNPLGVAVDGSGNLYVADSGLGYIVKVPAGCVSLNCETIVGGGFTGLSGVAVDGNGTVYALSGSTSGTVTKLSWNIATGGYAQVIIASGLSLPATTPSGVAVDGTGNLYFTDTANRHIVELPWIANANAYGTQIVLSTGTGSSAPTGVDVDSMGNLYIADPGAQTLTQLQPGGSQTTLATGINAGGVGVDASGNVYYTDPVANTVTKLPWDGSAFDAPVVMAASLNVPYGIAVDDSGNIFIANNALKAILKATVTVPPSLSFLNTKIDATSTDSPKIATLANIGNAALNFPPVSGINPALTTGFKLDGSTTCPQVYSTSPAQTLGQGRSCNFAVSFSPTSTNVGANSGTLVATDTDLNATSTTQTIPLSGTGIANDTSTVTVTLNPASVVFGKAVAIAATVRDTTTPATIPSGNVSFTSTNSASVTTTISSAATLSSGVATVASFIPTAVGTYTITGHYSGSVGDIAASTASASLAVTAYTPTLAYTPATSTETYGPAITAAALNATATDANGAAIAGAFTYTTMVNSVPRALVAGSTVLPVGTYTITATFVPADRTDYVSGGTITAGYTVRQSTAVVTLGNLAQSYTAAAHPVAAVTVPANLNVSLTYNGSSAVPVTAGSYTVLAAVNDANYSGTTSGTLVIAKASPAAVLLSSSVNPLLTRDTVLLTATVSSPFSTPGGVVTFLDGGTPLGTGVLSGGTATFSTSSLTVGLHTITAAYGGDPNFLPLASASLSESVLDFSISSGEGPASSVTVNPGGTASLQFNFSPIGAPVFPADVTLSASGLPAGATYTITPSTIAAGTGATNITLSIRLAQASAALRQNRPGSGRGAAPLALALLLLPFAGRMRTARRHLSRIGMVLLLLLIGLGATSLTGCAGGNGFLGEQQKSYTVTVTAKSGAQLVHSTTIELNVE